MLRNRANKFVRYVKEEYSCLQFISALAAGSAGMTVSMRATVDLSHPMNRPVRQSALSKHRILKLRSRMLKVRLAPRFNTEHVPLSLTQRAATDGVFDPVHAGRKELVLPTVLQERSRSAGPAVFPAWEPSEVRV